MNSFVDSYLETALWASTDEEGSPLDRDFNVEDFAPESIKLARKECKGFQEYASDELAEIDSSDEQDGHDFFLTRNGHGAGFWDRGYGRVGDELSKKAKSFGSADVYVGDDGLLYFGG